MELTDNQKQRILNIDIILSGLSMLGSVGGIIYSVKTGGGFWRGVGYFFAGGLIVGVPAQIIALPFKNKIIAETSEENLVDKITDIIK